MEKVQNEKNFQQSAENKIVELANSNEQPNTRDELEKKVEVEPEAVKETKEHLLEKKEEKKPLVSFWSLQCEFSDRTDIIFLIIAFIGSIGAGVSMPIFALIFGATINSFNDSNINNPQQLSSVVGNMAINYIIAGSGILFFSAIMVTFWTLNGKRLTKKIKENYFRLILQQEQGWFDSFNPFEFATRVGSQTKTIENGVRFNIFTH